MLVLYSGVLGFYEVGVDDGSELGFVSYEGGVSGVGFSD